MTRFGFGAQGMVLLGTSSSQDDKSLPGFEALAMPLFDSLYNFARWLVDTSNFQRCRGSRTKDLSQGFTQFRIVSVWHQFSRVDVPNPEEHVLSSYSTLERRMTDAIVSEENGSELVVDMENSRNDSNESL